MSNRYIHRYYLPQRQYIAGSPVILAAGALLEDTKLPRLVVQLKFENISPKIISALRLDIRCFAADGKETKGVGFLYKSLSIRRGYVFGQYTAIVLPDTNAYSFSAEIKYVDFHDGTRWAAKQGDGSSALREAKQKNRPLASPDAPPAQPPPSADGTPFVREGGLGDTTARPPPEPAPSPPTAHPLVGTTAPGRPPPTGRIKTKWIALAAAGAAVIIAAVLLLPQIIGNDSDTDSGQTMQSSMADSEDSAPPSQPSADANTDGNSAASDTPGPNTGTDNDVNDGIGTAADDATDETSEEGNTGPTMPAPTLPAPNNLRLDYSTNRSPHNTLLMWDWTPPDGEPADEYFFNVEYSVDGELWYIGMWQWEAIPFSPYLILGGEKTYSNADIVFRVYAWKGTDPASIEAISYPSDPSEPLTLIISDEKLSVTDAVFADEGNNGSSLTINSGNLNAGNIYNYCISDNFPVNTRTRKGSVVASPADVSNGSIEFEVFRSGYPAVGLLAQVWEISSQSIVGGRPTMTVRAADPIVITADESNVDTVRGAPQNVRFEISGNGVVQLVWDTPSWATDDTWALIEIKISSESDWRATSVGSVHAKTENRRAASGFVLRGSELRLNDFYQFRVRFAERNLNDPLVFTNFTDYAICPGTLSFSVGQSPFNVTAQYGNNTLTVFGDFAARTEYYFTFSSFGSNQIDGGFGFAPQNAQGRFDYDNHPYDLVGGSFYVWEISGGAVTGGNATANISATPAPVTIAAAP